MLKLRFGEQALGHCEVMLKDVKDSERINREVQKQILQRQEQINDKARGAFDFDLSKMYVKVVSRGDYWDRFPVGEEEEEEEPEAQRAGQKPLKLSNGFMPPEQVATNMSKFLKHYQGYKIYRTLKFNQAIGSVSLTLDFKNCSK